MRVGLEQTLSLVLVELKGEFWTESDPWKGNDKICYGNMRLKQKIGYSDTEGLVSWVWENQVEVRHLP